MLRKLRNGVFHYQQGLLNEKVVAFMREGERAVIWAFVLHEEFKRVIWELSHPADVGPEIRDQLAEVFEGMVGWLPRDIPEAAPVEAARRHREIAEMILKAGNRSDQHSKDLLEAANQFRAVAHGASANWSQQKRAMIDTLKRQHRLLADEQPGIEVTE